MSTKPFLLLALLVLPSSLLVRQNLGNSVDEQESYPVPEPCRTESDFMVGAFSCNFYDSEETGWQYHSWFREGKRFTYWPVLGRYDSSEPYAWDWQIKWAVEHGIGFFVFWWYWHSDPIEPWRSFRAKLEEGFLKAKYLGYVHFALSICTEPYGNRPTVQSVLDCVNDISRFFAHTQYLRIGGKPVLFMINTIPLVENLGAWWLTNAITEVRSQLKRNGHDVILVNAGLGAPNTSNLISSLFDAYTFQDTWSGSWRPPYLSFNSEGKPVMTAPYDELVLGWNHTASVHQRLLGDRLIPPVTPGYNNSLQYACPSRRGFENWMCVRTDSTGPKFERFVREMTRYCQTALGKMLLIFTWDEFGEGTFVLPSHELGFSRLDPIGRVVLKNQNCTHLIPAASSVGLIDRVTWSPSSLELRVKIRGTKGTSSQVAIFSRINPGSCMFSNGTRIQTEKWYNGTHITLPLRFHEEIVEVIFMYRESTQILTATQAVIAGIVMVASLTFTILALRRRKHARARTVAGRPRLQILDFWEKQGYDREKKDKRMTRISYLTHI